MKKYLLSFAVLMMGMATLTSCDDDEEESVREEVPGGDIDRTPQPIDVNYGIYVVNSGNEGSQIDGGLTYLDAETWRVEKDAFKSVNGRSLGLTANDGIVYGSKLYVVVTGENTVEIMDNGTLASLKQIKTAEVMGTEKGYMPRHITAAGGLVYVSTYGGYVAAIDTATFEVKRTYAVTPDESLAASMYPEGMAVSGNTLYVANSSYGNGQYPSVASINLESGTVTLMTDEKITNPTAVAVHGNDVYVLDYGTYDASWNQTGAGVRKISDGEISIVVDATAMTVAGSKIYTINAPYNSDPTVKPSYLVYDMETGATSEFLTDGEWQDGTYVKNPSAPFSAAAICADPVRGYVYMASYSENPDYPGYAGYSIDGYINVYNMNGSLLLSRPCGVGPTAIVLNTGVVYE